jgi:hypothetical protein
MGFGLSTRPIQVMGFPLPVRMTAIRLASGALVLHSPTRFYVKLREELDQLGRIEHVTAPNSAHWSFVKDWQAHVIGVTTWAAPGLRQRSQVRHSNVKLDDYLGDQAPHEWVDEIEQFVFAVPVDSPKLRCFIDPQALWSLRVWCRSGGCKASVRNMSARVHCWRYSSEWSRSDISTGDRQAERTRSE